MHRFRFGEAQRDGEMLIDVGVNGKHGQSLRGQVTTEQSSKSGFSAPTFAHKGNSHLHILQKNAPVSRASFPQGRRERSRKAGSSFW
jgi:hypothetical protein